MRTLKFSSKQFDQKLDQFCRAGEMDPAVTRSVAEILEGVREGGDRAVLEYTRKFDGARLRASDLRVPESRIQSALTDVSLTQRKAIKKAVHCVEEFQKAALPQNWKSHNPHGAEVGETYHPLHRVGLYIPGGAVPLVSTVVMTVTLAKLAKVPEIAVFTPPRKEGEVAPEILAALRILRIDEVYRVGGVQAIGAMAFGTRKIPAVDKIFGPGNAYVTEAKRQVFGRVGIDLLPGPSEVMVIADETARPDYVAADLLAQAEHGSGRERVFLVTTEHAFVAKVNAEIRLQLLHLSHADAIQRVLDDGFLVVEVADLDEAAAVADRVAPEHLELHVDRAQFSRLSRAITTAGAILLGDTTPTVLGDFTAGPSHVLPTGRTGRFFSGLRISDFMRRTSVVQYTPRNLLQAWPTVQAFSELEHLDAHGRSMELRLEELGGSRE